MAMVWWPRRPAGRAGGAMAKAIRHREREAQQQGTTAAIYVRVSTEQQDSAHQLPDCRQLAAARGWRVVDVFKDDAVQGDARTRPGLEQALLGAHAGRF